MRERPILMSGPLVRAILAGTKTQTRRVITPQPVLNERAFWNWKSYGWQESARGPMRSVLEFCPYGQPGDRLWVREAHAIFSAHGQHRSDGKRWGPWGGLPTVLSPDGSQIAYFREGFDRADPGRWRPSIHMPRWASRLTLAVESIRVERLQDITQADARAEGVVDTSGAWGDLTDTDRAGPRGAFEALWNRINSKRPGCSWEANPFVWAITFRVAEVRR